MINKNQKCKKVTFLWMIYTKIRKNVAKNRVYSTP